MEKIGFCADFFAFFWKKKFKKCKNVKVNDKIYKMKLKNVKLNVKIGKWSLN